MPQQFLSLLNKPKAFQLVIKKLPTVVSLAIIVLCIHTLWQIAQEIFVVNEPIIARENIPVKTVTNKNEDKAFKQLMSANIFGVADQKKVKTITKIPKTKLNLFLKGVFANTPMANSTAIIASGKNGMEDSYSVGDKLTGGVTISEIHSDYVILDRNGRSEILRMPESKSVGELVSVIPDLSDVMQVVDADMLDIVRNKIIAAPYTLRDYALPVVVKENSKQIGYRLQPLQHGYVLSDIGIEPDDVVTAVNDIRLNDPKNATRALRELITAKDVFITIKRGGDEISFKAKIQ